MARIQVLAMVAALAVVLGVAPARAQKAYIPKPGLRHRFGNCHGEQHTVVVGSPITVGSEPYGVAVAPGGSNVYVTNFASNTVSVISAQQATR